MSDQLSEQVEHLARARGLDISPEVVAEAVTRVLAALGDGPGAVGQCAASNGQGLNAEHDYPLATKRPDLVQSASGLPLAEITLDKVIAGQIKFEDIKTRP